MKAESNKLTIEIAKSQINIVTTISINSFLSVNQTISNPQRSNQYSLPNSEGKNTVLGNLCFKLIPFPRIPNFLGPLLPRHFTAVNYRFG